MVNLNFTILCIIILISFNSAEELLNFGSLGIEADIVTQ